MKCLSCPIRKKIIAIALVVIPVFLISVLVFELPVSEQQWDIADIYVSVTTIVATLALAFGNHSNIK